MFFKKKDLNKEIKNFTINFGPQHPAAHGVLFINNKNIIL
jgi:NADH:ubiquinone oxidoreductase subunit D